MLNAQRLINLRKGKGLKQADIANILGVQRTTYVKYEKNGIQPPTDIVTKIANYFDVSTDYLLGNTDDPTPPSKRGMLMHPEEALQILARGKNLTKNDVEDLKKLINLMEFKNNAESMNEFATEGTHATN